MHIVAQENIYHNVSARRYIEHICITHAANEDHINVGRNPEQRGWYGWIYIEDVKPIVVLSAIYRPNILAYAWFG
jgi:hypothetical protein